MKHKENHLNQDELIEYFYKESPNTEEIEGHLKSCKRCYGRYLALKKDMETISGNLKQEFWARQHQEIVSKVSAYQGAKSTLWVKWLRPAFIAAIFVFLIIGAYLKFNYHPPVQYTRQDISEELFLEHVSDLVNQPLTSALDYLDFQEEGEQEESDTSPFDKLELFGYWPELEA